MKRLLRGLRNLAATGLLIWVTLGTFWIVPHVNQWAELVLALLVLTIAGYYAGRSIRQPRWTKGGAR